MIQISPLKILLSRKQFNNWLFRVLKGFLVLAFFGLFYKPKCAIAQEVNSKDLKDISAKIASEWVEINKKYGKGVSKEDQEKIEKKTEETGAEILKEKGYEIKAPSGFRIKEIQ